MDFEVAWPLGLSLGGLGSVSAFWAGKTAKTLPAQWRRLLCALAALLAAGTAFPVALTGLFFLVFGATGYCEDYGGLALPAGGCSLALGCSAS